MYRINDKEDTTKANIMTHDATCPNQLEYRKTFHETEGHWKATKTWINIDIIVLSFNYS